MFFRRAEREDRYETAFHIVNHDSLAGSDDGDHYCAVLPGAGHFPAWEASAEVAAAILSFHSQTTDSR